MSIQTAIESENRDQEIRKFAKHLASIRPKELATDTIFYAIKALTNQVSALLLDNDKLRKELKPWRILTAAGPVCLCPHDSLGKQVDIVRHCPMHGDDD